MTDTNTNTVRPIWLIAIGIIIGVGSAAIYILEVADSEITIQAENPQIMTAGITIDDIYPKAKNPNPQKRSYTLIAQDAEIEVSKGVKATVWTYNGTVPAPTLRFDEGDEVEVKFVNDTPYAHTIHFHGTHNSANDGVFPMINPGDEYTYSFKAHEAGFFMYHCHAFPTTEHVRMGMFGAMIIDPVHHDMEPAREYLFVLSEFDPEDPLATFTKFYPINGYANQYMDNPIQVVEGETTSDSNNSEDCPPSFSSRCFAGKITEVVNGDTVQVDDIEIHLALISTPQPGEEGWKGAKGVVERYCPDGTDALVDQDNVHQPDGVTFDAQVLAVVYCNGYNINEILLQRELATFDSTYCHDSEFADESWARADCSE